MQANHVDRGQAMEDGWCAERFTSGLRATLLAKLAGGGTAALQDTVADCAAAADRICQRRPIACGPGCPHCCVLNVAILLPEAMVIAEWLQLQPPTIFAALRARLVLHCCSVRWMDDEERMFRQAACPLLDSAGNCSIHPVRPLVCRAAASLDASSCREAFRPFLHDQERGMAVDLERQAVFDAAFMALAEALRLHGLDDRSIELGTGVLAFLERPDCRQLLLAGSRLPHELWE